jgi:hypothetical protein
VGENSVGSGEVLMSDFLYAGIKYDIPYMQGTS